MNQSLSKVSIFYENFSYFYNILIALLCIMGMLGNALSTRIYLHFRSSPINILLACLSVSDFLIVFCVIFVFSNSFNILSQSTLIYAQVYIYPISHMFVTFSVWILLLITFERWLAVCKPLHVAVYCSRNRTLAGLIMVFILSISFNMCRFWEYTVVQLPNGSLQPTYALRANRLYVIWYDSFASITFVYVIPLIFMIIMNSLVAREIRNSNRTRFLFILGSRRRRKHGTTKMLVYVVLCFICCYSLSLCLNLVELINPAFFQTWKGRALNDVNNALIVINASTTFLFYLRFSSRYREASIAMFRCGTVNDSASPSERSRSTVRFKLSTQMLTSSSTPLIPKIAKQSVRMERKEILKVVKSNSSGILSTAV